MAQNDELVFSDDILASATSNAKKSSASEQVYVKMEFPGNEYQRPKRSNLATGEPVKRMALKMTPKTIHLKNMDHVQSHKVH